MTEPDNPKRGPLYSPQDRDNIRWFWLRYLKRKALWLTLALVLLLIQGLVYQQFLSNTEEGLRVIFESGSVSDLIWVCTIVFGLFFIRGLISYLVPLITVWVANTAIFEMRRDLIAHLMALDLAYFERTKSGEIILKIVTQTQQLGVFVALSIANAVRDGITVVIVAAYLIYKNPILFFSAVVVLPFIIWIMNIISDRVKTGQAEIEDAQADYMNGIEETVNGMRTVKIASQEGVEKTRLMRETESLRRLITRVQWTQSLAMPSIDLSSAVVYVLVIGGGGYMVLSPNFDVDGPEIITFLLGMVMIFDPARLLAQFFGGLQANLILLDKIRGLYKETPTIVDATDAKDSFDTSGDITLRNVDFSYSAEQPLFKDLNMTFKGGGVSAIVGSTGSGKTTILSLLSRLYDVQNGDVTIGGQKIDQLQVEALRGAFSVVAQDIVIFNASIWDNIRYVNPQATEAQIWQAAEDAEIADLIRRRGDASVGPKGAQLSGGQKQRIAIARAFLRDAPILLLDEATSALDQATEARIKAALDRLTKGKTTIVVAHRLSSISNADQIFVLEAGQLVDQGKHDELLERGGLYAQLYQAQKQGYEKPA